jgi:hypothetical protein
MRRGGNMRIDDTLDALRKDFPHRMEKVDAMLFYIGATVDKRAKMGQEDTIRKIAISQIPNANKYFYPNVS